MKRPAPGTEAFGAHVCDGLKLEYCAQRVVVKRSHALTPATGAAGAAGAGDKRRFSEVDADAAARTTKLS